jgi:hypothetical protein
MFLISWALPHKLFSISIHVWTEESTLPNLSMGPECSVVSSIWRGVTTLQNCADLT